MQLNPKCKQHNCFKINILKAAPRGSDASGNEGTAMSAFLCLAGAGLSQTMPSTEKSRNDKPELQWAARLPPQK